MTAALYRRAGSTAIALVVFVSCFAPVGYAEDLAALARKEKARRAKIKTSGKVFTENDAKTGGNVTETGPPAASAAPAPSNPVVSSDAARASWKARADAARAAIVAAEKALEQQEKEAVTYRSDLTQVSAADAQDPLRLQKREARIAEMYKLVESRKAAVAAARAALVALEDEARRAGVPPGWLR